MYHIPHVYVIRSHIQLQAGWVAPAANLLFFVLRSGEMPPRPHGGAQPAAPAAGSDDLASECVVCFLHRANHAFVPCGHLAICDVCKDSFTIRSGRCPLCRRPYTMVMQIFGPPPPPSGLPTASVGVQTTISYMGNVASTFPYGGEPPGPSSTPAGAREAPSFGGSSSSAAARPPPEQPDISCWTPRSGERLNDILPTISTAPEDGWRFYAVWKVPNGPGLAGVHVGRGDAVWKGLVAVAGSFGGIRWKRFDTIWAALWVYQQEAAKHRVSRAARLHSW